MRPLEGKRVVVTRPRAQAAEMVAQLERLGATPILLPAIQIVPPADDYAALDAALADPRPFDWIVFTSVNGVEHVWQRLAAAGKGGDALAPARLAAIGSATAAALRERGYPPTLVPERFVAESLLAALRERSIAGKRFLLPRADIARAALHEGLVAAGAEVTEPHAYRTVPATPDPAALAALETGVDLLTFTSSSTVRYVVAQLGEARAQQLAARARVATIGPITSRTARALGLPVHIEAQEYTIPGLLAAIVEHYQPTP